MAQGELIEHKRKAILIRFFALHGKLIVKDGLYDSRDIGYVAEKDEFVFDEWSPRENVSYRKTVMETNRVWDWVLEEEPEKLKQIAAEMETGTAKLFDSFADTYQEKYMDVSLYQDTLAMFCDLIPSENASLLDIACGPGNITRYLLDTRPDFKILGIDLAPKMIGLAKKNNPEAEFRIMDARDIDQLDQQFAGIVCGFCFPYLFKEEALKLITNAANLLGPQGALYISTMEGDESKSGWQGPSSGGDERLYMHFHQADYLKAGLLAAGFSKVDVYRQNYSAGGGSDTVDLILIGLK